MTMHENAWSLVGSTYKISLRSVGQYIALHSCDYINLNLQFCRTAIKLLAINNRAALAAMFGLAIAGGIIMTDWQAIGTDQCTLFCANKTSSLSDTNSSNISNPFETCAKITEEWSLGMSYSISDIADSCEAASTSKHTCFWNPRSRITGKYCADCTRRCNSIQKSLYFAQLCVGSMILILVLHVIVPLVNVVTSDYTPTKYQVINNDTNNLQLIK